MERISRSSRTLENATNQLQDQIMEASLATLRVTNPCQNTATKDPQDVAPNIPEEKL